jgi:sugar lactone lactonase YvrE
VCLILSIAGTAWQSFPQQGIITTYAGGGSNSTVALSAEIVTPLSVAVDSSGSIYIATDGMPQVFRVDRSGGLTVVAGTSVAGFSGDGGPATSASLSGSSGAAVDSHGNLFIADTWNDRIRRVDAATGIITTVAGDGSWGFSGDGGPATSAGLYLIEGVAVDASGNLFIADNQNARIRRVDAVTGIITTVAGNGTWGYSGDGGLATSASLNLPMGVAVDVRGNLLIADEGNSRVRRVDAVTGIITTVAGDGNWGYSGDGGLATSASLAWPLGVAVDALGNLFIADSSNNRIRRVDATTGIITTVAGDGNSGFSGDGGPATSATLHWPAGVAVDLFGTLFIADYYNNRVRVVGLPGFFAPSASELTFASQKVATTSKPQVITLTNTGTVTLDIESLALGGTDPTDFAWSASGMCQGGVQPGEDCQISVTFTPQKAGSRSATLTITDNAPGSLQTVTLSGTGSS